MPFGLKNAGASYQRLVDKSFDNQVGRNIEVYIDDLVIKSHTEVEMLRDIDETFRTLCKINMKLNPKTKAVLQLPSPRKELEKSLPLFKTLTKCIKKTEFHWTPDAEQAFKKPKQHLSELPLLVAPKPKEELIVYLSASHEAISAVLMTERGTVQTSVYFVSRALQGPKLNYNLMEKLVLSLVFAAKRLQRYFQAHPIAVITGQLIKQIISRLDVARRLQKWSVLLGEHNITYRPRTFVKGQILADFLVKKPDKSPPDTSVVETQQEPWTLFTDGSSCVDGSSAGLILTSPYGTEFTYALRFQFTTSNNKAEYEALIVGPQIVAQMEVRNIHVSVDSNLVANQVLGAYIAKEENMIKYMEKVKSLVLVKILKEKSIQEKEVTTMVEEEGPTWMTPIIEYLKDGTLPDDRKEPSKLRIKARKYELLEGVLYRRSFLKPWLRTKKNQISNSRYGLFHEVDRGKSRSNNDRELGEEVRVGQHNMPLRSPRRNSFRQCKTSAVQRTRVRSNWSLGEGIKARLGEGNENWIEELPHVLWAHRTMIKSSHSDTPFSLTYGTEAVIPTEIKMPMYRTVVVDAVHNDEELRLNLELLDERREHAVIHKAKAKSKMTKYYNAKVCGVTFRPGYFVYRSNEAIHAMDGGKLGLKWEGPYEVMEALRDGAYRLRSMDGIILPQTWNIANLKKCYL
ncbi:reverse transcriptase domain-containing protein [Tanacetum coccineum]|uniref:Reverse transcriptase domain-containing protein n=1 Tax=Tanacetum coccineum TaxID=301880 RepID=A0ABQ5DT54_9ASTR